MFQVRRLSCDHLSNEENSVWIYVGYSLKNTWRHAAEGKLMSFREDLGQCGHPYKLNSIISGIAM